MQIDINEKLKNRVENLAHKYGLNLVLLFGSQAKGQTHKESDVDVAYVPEKSLDFNQECYLNYEFTNIFRQDRVDTVDIKKAPPLLMYAVFDHPQILFQLDDKIFSIYQAYAFKRYIEAKPIFEERSRRLQKYVNNIRTYTFGQD
ncbi:MAG: nucleotidyltransferase domain-containing protein [Candidatus Taylorbacteria bacterium]|nr:nucleotidyltransferase domain-containing protein [Candidatus Taylorbacteria bacterium]